MSTLKNYLYFSPIIFLLSNIINYVILTNSNEICDESYTDSFEFYALSFIPTINNTQHYINNVMNDCQRAMFVFKIYSFSFLSFLSIVTLNYTLSFFMKSKRKPKSTINETQKSFCLALLSIILISQIFDNIGTNKYSFFSNISHKSDISLIINIISLSICIFLSNIYPLSWVGVEGGQKMTGE